jgi:peroxiredoxin
MRPWPSPRATLAIAVLAVATVWITWRAKVLERSLHTGTAMTALLRKPAPEFSLRTLDGRSVSLADFRGKQKVVVSFWASWCGPCRLETPALNSFYQKTHKAGADFEFLALSIDTERTEVEDFAAKMKMPFPVLLDPSRKAADAYGVEAIPQLFVIDKNGTIVYGHLGFDPALQIALAKELGIKDYSPILTAPAATTGAPSGNTSP